MSVYHVLPPEAGQYFNKIQCFCFEEQMLNPRKLSLFLSPFCVSLSLSFLCLPFCLLCVSPSVCFSCLLLVLLLSLSPPYVSPCVPACALLSLPLSPSVSLSLSVCLSLRLSLSLCVISYLSLLCVSSQLLSLLLLLHLAISICSFRAFICCLLCL